MSRPGTIDGPLFQRSIGLVHVKILPALVRCRPSSPKKTSRSPTFSALDQANWHPWARSKLGVCSENIGVLGVGLPNPMSSGSCDGGFSGQKYQFCRVVIHFNRPFRYTVGFCSGPV